MSVCQQKCKIDGEVLVWLKLKIHSLDRNAGVFSPLSFLCIYRAQEKDRERQRSGRSGREKERVKQGEREGFGIESRAGEKIIGIGIDDGYQKLTGIKGPEMLH